MQSLCAYFLEGNWLPGKCLLGNCSLGNCLQGSWPSGKLSFWETNYWEKSSGKLPLGNFLALEILCYPLIIHITQLYLQVQRRILTPYQSMQTNNPLTPFEFLRYRLKKLFLKGYIHLFEKSLVWSSDQEGLCTRDNKVWESHLSSFLIFSLVCPHSSCLACSSGKRASRGGL